MKRIQEKVKDLIEVRSYKVVRDLISDPEQTLAVYHFTDATSDLMAKWLDDVAAIHGTRGAANAVAGYRGVGKSHFLATLGAILSHPELRSGIAEPHVAAAAQRLKRIRYKTGYVRRGTHKTLFEELKAAIANTLETDAANLSDSLGELLSLAAEKSGETPFVLIIDTAFERSSRVARDDGVLLGEIAEIAKSLNIFAAVALDDDIAGADGINAAIVRSFSIDYLDQEHLYRVVDTNVFPKHRQTAPLLREIYANFRQVMPDFRWSEQRFISLYPLHPVILESAPFVRLYAPEFALLGFAAEAGGKILGRPANSLIALDEVFDSVEPLLRKVEDLREVFAVYDKLNTEIISQIPIMQRLQAKLVLKALFVLSLEGEGATAGEIAAAMLIYDEADPSGAIKAVEDLLKTFISTFPEDIRRAAEKEKGIRYSLKVEGRDNFNNALTRAVKEISPAAATKVLRRAARERFPDWTLADENHTQNAASTDCRVVWRGGLRRGCLFWNFDNQSTDLTSPPENSGILDWEVIIGQPQSAEKNRNEEISKIYWQPAPLEDEEIETLLRYHVLLTDAALREEYGEQIHAAAQSHLLSAEKIWNRIFLEDSKLLIEGFEQRFSEEAKAAQTLSDLLSITLEPFFESRYPNHPFFSQTLGVTEVSQLVNNFFSGARQTLAESQRLAEIFALPLGLVVKHGNSLVLEREENLINLPLARKILSLVGENAENAISLKTIYKRLKQPPFGLGREAQHLILTALVAQRQIEFVTKNNDRINRRSLDLTIIWDDIEGVARPQGVFYSNERLAEWARLLTGSDVFYSIDTPEDSASVREALENWLADWRSAGILEQFDELPSDVLNTKIWRLATRAGKTFGAVAETISTVLNKSISLEEGLHRIADTFSDSESEFFDCTEDLVVLEDFIEAAGLYEKIQNYLSVCESTEDEKIEYSREKLAEVLIQSRANPSAALNKQTRNLWRDFHVDFSDYFAVKHEAAMNSRHLREKFNDVLNSEEWREFENLSQLEIFRQDYRKKARQIQRQFKELGCRFDVAEMLKTHPFCACSFSLEKAREWENLSDKFEEIINRGRDYYSKTLRTLSETLIPPIETLSARYKDDEFSKSAFHLIEFLKGAKEIHCLTNNEFLILQAAFENLQPLPKNIELSEPTPSRVMK